MSMDRADLFNSNLRRARASERVESGRASIALSLVTMFRSTQSIMAVAWIATMVLITTSVVSPSSETTTMNDASSVPDGVYDAALDGLVNDGAASNSGVDDDAAKPNDAFARNATTTSNAKSGADLEEEEEENASDSDNNDVSPTPNVRRSSDDGDKSNVVEEKDDSGTGSDVIVGDVPEDEQPGLDLNGTLHATPAPAGGGGSNATTQTNGTMDESGVDAAATTSSSSNASNENATTIPTTPSPATPSTTRPPSVFVDPREFETDDKDLACRSWLSKRSWHHSHDVDDGGDATTSSSSSTSSPSLPRCVDLPVACFNCSYDYACVYGGNTSVACAANVDCAGERTIERNLTCRYCFQTKFGEEHVCTLRNGPNNNNGVGGGCRVKKSPTSQSRFKSNCTVKPHVLCLGRRTFNKMLRCNWTSGYRWTTSLLLSIFLGGFGADRFYLGQWREGIGKLFSFGGLGVWTVIDVILISIGYIGPQDGSLYIY